MTDRLYQNATKLLHDLKEKGFEISAPVDVDKVAEMLGISVEMDFSLDDDQIVGQILFSNDKPVVRINPVENSYEPRRRFTLAHEIGHFCLHAAISKRGFTDSRKTMSRSESYWDVYESEANGFAAQLLMPKTLLIAEGNQIISNYLNKNNVKSMPSSVFVDLMASKFNVSNKAMEYRLKNLKILK